MKTTLYYFSGTGNSLAVAKELAENLPETVNLLPIPKYERGKRTEVDGDILGVVFPCYFQSIPDTVRSFLRNLEFSSNPYIFSVVTCNGQPGHSLYTIRRMLKRKNRSLAAGFAVDMPGNALFGVDYTNTPEVQRERLANAKIKIPLIAQAIRERNSGVIAGKQFPGTYLRGMLFRTAVKYFYRPSKRFWVQNQCTHCGACAQVCPQKNITMARERGPVWGGDCALCLACFHWCPRQAIQMSEYTIGKTRYQHPEISHDEMMTSRL
ncbi:MAG TPA: EFR1 family ferrodoxin [Bacillota bacterium]|nr:EFR1 family ferrodoxin [Bacillota bacterium]